jgi:hypothetical protein
MCAATVSAHDPEDVDRFFRGLTENAFHGQLGVVDPPLVDYVAGLLVRFIRSDGLRGVPFRTAAERDRLAQLLEDAPPADTALAEYRRIGDASLFWTGLYPEALRRFRPLDYRAVGRRAYWVASTLEPEDSAEERLLMERLSSEYDVCVAGLAEVRRAWSAA